MLSINVSVKTFIHSWHKNVIYGTNLRWITIFCKLGFFTNNVTFSLIRIISAISRLCRVLSFTLVDIDAWMYPYSQFLESGNSYLQNLWCFFITYFWRLSKLPVRYLSSIYLLFICIYILQMHSSLVDQNPMAVSAIGGDCFFSFRTVQRRLGWCRGWALICHFPLLIGACLPYNRHMRIWAPLRGRLTGRWKGDNLTGVLVRKG